MGQLLSLTLWCLSLLQMTRAPQGEKSSRRGFDEKAYLSSKVLKAGEDPYRQHAFNQLESDKLSSDRAIRDTRHYRYPAAPAPSPGCCCGESTALLWWSAMLTKGILWFSLPAMVHYFTEFHGSFGKVSNAQRTLTNSVPACDFSNISFSSSEHHLVLAQPLHCSSNCSLDSCFLPNSPHTHSSFQHPSVLAAKYTFVAALLCSGVSHLLCPGCLKLVWCFFPAWTSLDEGCWGRGETDVQIQCFMACKVLVVLSLSHWGWIYSAEKNNP